MTYIGKAFGIGKASNGRAAGPDIGRDAGQERRLPTVLVIEDDENLSTALVGLCECLSISVVQMSTHADLRAVLRQQQPMAVVAAMDGVGQDGCHVLMMVAAHDRDLPVLLITGNDPTLLGAVDAVEEIWRLSSAMKCPELPRPGALVDFLFRAGRKAGCMRLMPV